MEVENCAVSGVKKGIWIVGLWSRTMLDLLERKAFGLLTSAAHLGSVLPFFRTEVENCSGPAEEEGIWLVNISCSPWLCVDAL